jgi:hypothetical protein
MKHSFNTIERGLDRCCVIDVPFDKLHLISDLIKITPMAGAEVV